MSSLEAAMVGADWSEENRCRLRSRIEYEDGLLNTRTEMFLIVNGLAATAIGLASDLSAKLIIAVVSIAINLFWLICAQHSLRVIRVLTRKYIEVYPQDDIEQLIQTVLGKRLWLRPTNIISEHIPRFILAGWLIGTTMLVIGLLTV